MARIRHKSGVVYGAVLWQPGLRRNTTVRNRWPGSNNQTIKLFQSLDALYIYYQLLSSRTIILKSIIKNISDEEEEDIGSFLHNEFSCKININI